MNRYPPYLRDGDPDAYHYGTLSYNRRRKCWEIHAEPCVTEMAKRLFPGCEGSGRGLGRFTTHRPGGEDTKKMPAPRGDFSAAVPPLYIFLPISVI